MDVMGRRERGIAFLLAFCMSLGLAARALGPALTAPEGWLVGSWMHPDCLSNHWLLAWVADRAASLQGMLHNGDYYWPVGDAPVLAGNGTQGLAYLPFHLVWGWPGAVPRYLLVAMTLSGLGGYALARAAGADPWSALLLPALTVASPFVCGELGAGRFSQADTAPLLFFSASWLWLLARPSSGRALLSASLLALTSFFYWYYGFFGVLFGGVMVLVHGWRTLGIRVLVVFVASFSAMIGPWLGLFISRWADIPGTDELAVFPPMQALGDAAALTWPWSVGGGRAEGTAVPLPLLLLGGLGAFGGLLRGAGQRRRNLGLVLAFLLFAGLSVGPAFPGAPYTILYGLAEPLRRYWWPLRHVVLAVPLVGVLAALALTLLRARVSRAWPTRLGVVFPAVLAVGLACATPALLAAQGAPTRVPLTAMRLPPPVYPELATRSPGVLLEPPLSPELSGTQHHLLLQRWHGHALLTGHAPWVERVRPPAWDRFIEENSFLSALQALERGELGDGPLSFDPLDLTSLRQAGLQTVTVNRAALPLKARPLVEAYVVLFDGLFGPAIARAPGIWAWDVDGWDGETSTVVLPSWSWPDALRRGGPEAPLVARRPRSQIFEREPMP